MKSVIKKTFLVLTAACCCIFTSCSKWPEGEFPFEIDCEKDTIGYEGGDVALYIHPLNGKWRAWVSYIWDEDGNTLPNNLVKVSPDSGRGDKKITVSIPENNTSKKIIIRISINLYNRSQAAGEDIVITQEGNPNVDDE